MSVEDQLDIALLANAKVLYFQFLTLKAIFEQTGISLPRLRQLAYGSGDKDEKSWFNQRRAVFAEDYVEVGERNRFAAHQYAAAAFDLMMRSMNALATAKDGNAKSLTTLEMDRLASSLVKVDRLLRLTSGLPTDIVGFNDSEGGIAPPVLHHVIDIEKVSAALSKDKSMQRRLMSIFNKEQVNGTGICEPNESETSAQPGDGSAAAETGISSVASGGVDGGERSQGDEEKSGLAGIQNRLGARGDEPQESKLVSGTATTVESRGGTGAGIDKEPIVATDVRGDGAEGRRTGLPGDAVESRDDRAGIRTRPRGKRRVSKRTDKRAERSVDEHRVDAGPSEQVQGIVPVGPAEIRDDGTDDDEPEERFGGDFQDPYEDEYG